MDATVKLHNRAKFIDAIERRTSNAIKAIRAVGKLSGRKDLIPEDIQAVHKRLLDEVDAMHSRLRKHDVLFKL